MIGRQHHTRLGFTLIELLVVISIISLLIAILMPALANARNAAKKALCMSNMRQYGISAMYYDLDYKELPMTSGNSNVHNQYNLEAVNALYNSYGMLRKFKACPSAPTWDREQGSTTITMYDLLGGRHDYSGNSVTINGWRMIGRNWPRYTFGWYPQLSAIKPDFDSIMPYFYADIVHTSLTPNITIPPVSNHYRGDGVAEGGNLLYLDGHVKWNPLVADSSWKAGGSAYINHYMNDPNYLPPTGAAFYTP